MSGKRKSDTKITTTNDLILPPTHINRASPSRESRITRLSTVDSVFSIEIERNEIFKSK